jgi:hypothetical protein
MSDSKVAQCWSRRFGLASAPLFEARDAESKTPGYHEVLLDGGNGTFALSESSQELWREQAPAEWVWSSDIPHHVTLTHDKVAVLRWDRPSEPHVYGRPSVERNLDGFYSYLIKDRLRSNKTVVDHLLNLFRRLRSLCHAARIADDRVTDVFTSTLAILAARDRVYGNPLNFGLAEDALDLRARLDGTALAAAEHEIGRASGSLAGLRLHPMLAIRHAGGQLFQEAHFELLSAPVSPDLFGLIDAPEAQPANRGGTHYTPPALARSIVEQTLAAVGDLNDRSDLTICDPACGSGAFLHEVLRALRRMDFRGRLHLIGHDISAPAIAMARFALRTSICDWSPATGVELTLRIGDSLGELGIPAADIIIMNPPFIAFGAQTTEQRAQVREAMDGAGNARADYSMAFILRATQALNAGGVLGTLFPASLLSLKAAIPWREKLADISGIRLLASIGEFGLFTHALVQVGCMILGHSNERRGDFIVLVTGNDTRATGEALRFLRKNGPTPPVLPIVEENWSLFSVPEDALKNHATWRFPSPNSARLVRALAEAGLPNVGQLFEVAQGIQTGLNEVLLLKEEEWRAIPPKERRYFRLATMSDSIRNGRVEQPYYLFFPHTAEGPLFNTEAELKNEVPAYYKGFLAPNRQRLANRASIVRSGRTDWWGLMEPRTRAWSTGRSPRIISKFFAAEGGFAGDYDAEYLVVMGHVWSPRRRLDCDNEEEMLIDDILAAYVAVFNSTPFVRLLALYSPHVAGGQFDLSRRHVDPIPLPDLREISMDPERGLAVSNLAALGRSVSIADPVWRAQTLELVTAVYGTRALADL